MFIELKNTGSCESNIYYPRLMVNKYQEIVLAIRKEGTLTTGIYVGQADDHEPRWKIGQKFTDWEVAGPLVDYDGEISITFQNKVKRNDI